jgi:ribosomal protein S18 acetylase RimI-like enzyme
MVLSNLSSIVGVLSGLEHNLEQELMIRPIVPTDSPALVALSASSGLFKPDELEAIQGMLDEYFSTNAANGHQIITYDEGDTLVGIAYFVPKEFTDRVWELLMIAVDAPRHRQGIGSVMLLAVETAVRAANGRLLLIETSSQSSFERTRLFYRKHGYTEVAHIPDFFADGDGKASFIKRV